MPPIGNDPDAALLGGLDLTSIVRTLGVVLLVAACTSLPLAAAGITHAGSAVAPSAPTAPNGPGCGPEVVTQSTSQAITALNSVSCNSGGLHADNSYFRAFDLAGAGYLDGFDVCSVEIGVELADAGDPATTQPVTVRLYRGPSGFPTGFPGSFVQIASSTVQMADAALSIVSVPLLASVPAGDSLVVEVFTPDGQVAGHSFFIGSNSAGESAPSYLAAADCGITAPTTTSAIGFGNMQIVLNVVGDVPQQSVLEVPTLGGWGLALLALFLGASAVLLLRRRTA